MTTPPKDPLAAIREGTATREDFERAIAAATPPSELQEIAELYNWDDGLAVVRNIASHPAAGLGVALELFWLADGIVAFEREFVSSEHDAEWMSLCRHLYEGIISGKYEAGDVSFDPQLGRVGRYKLEKAGVPIVLIEPAVCE